MTMMLCCRGMPRELLALRWSHLSLPCTCQVAFRICLLSARSLYLFKFSQLSFWQGLGERLPRRTFEQQAPKALAPKAVVKAQEPGARQSFRGQLAFNPLRAPSAAPTQAAADSDSDEEQWQRIKAGQVPVTRRLSAAASAVLSTASVAATAQARRLSLTTRPVPPATAKSPQAGDSDSDDEQWQRMKKMATEKPRATAVPSGRGSLSGRLSISRNNPNSAPSQAASKVQSDSDDERWAMVRAARAAAATGAARNGGAVGGGQRGAAQADASDSDDEQWRRAKAQVTARALPATGDSHMPV